MWFALYRNKMAKDAQMNITLHNITKRFGKKNVFSTINWNITDGQIWRICGPSGCGKTTLLRILMGLERPSSGTIQGIQSIRFSAVFQENRLLPARNAIENLQFVCDMDDSQALVWMHTLLAHEDCLRPVEELSGGMQRRVAIVRALAASSDIVVLDEPFTGLDTCNIAHVSDFIQSSIHERTLILSSHVDSPLFSKAGCLHLGQNPVIIDSPSHLE